MLIEEEDPVAAPQIPKRQLFDSISLAIDPADIAQRWRRQAGNSYLHHRAFRK